MASFFKAILLVTLYLLSSGCSGSSQEMTSPKQNPLVGEDSLERDDPVHEGEEEWQFRELSRFVVDVDGEGRQVVLVEALHASGSQHYLQFIPASEPNAPFMVIHEPYSGIDWSGDEIDELWVGLVPGRYADRFAPDYNGVDEVPYKLLTVESATAAADIWHQHGFSTITAFGRFYQGSNLEGDILDGLAAYYLAAQVAGVQTPVELYAFGGSWGGMMALFSSHAAPESLKPRAIAAVSPLSHMGAQVDYISALFDDNIAAARTFFSPYLRRIKDAMEADRLPDSYVTLSPTDLCQGLPQSTLVLHDDIDSIIPVTQSEDLQRACSSRVSTMIWHRTTAADPTRTGMTHGDFNSVNGTADVRTISTAWLLDAAQVPNRTVPASRENLQLFFGQLAEARERRDNIQFASEALRVLTAPELELIDDNSSQVIPAIDFITPLINNSLGSDFTTQQVNALLRPKSTP